MCAVVCSARAGDVYAEQVPAGLHVSAQRTNASSSPLHRHPIALHCRAVRHQRTRHHLHHFPCHGRNHYHLK